MDTRLKRLPGRRSLLAGLAGMALVAGSLSLGPQAGGWAGAWNGARPLTIVVSFPPGGGTDLLARRLGEQLQQRLGRTVIVENRPGASGNIAAQLVAQAGPDASTLLMVNSSFAINPGVYRHLDFDPLHDFKAVFNAGNIASVLVVPAAGPLQSLGQALATASPAAPLAYASCGNGTPQHLGAQMLAEAAGVILQHVPYKGCAPAVAAVAAGQVPAGMVTLSSAWPLLEAGRLRALGVTSLRRQPQLPEVPTVAEQGLAGFEAQQWHGLLAPAAMPDAQVDGLHQVLSQIIEQPAMREALSAQGYTRVRQTPRQFQQLIADDMQRYARLTQSLGLGVD
ncbi:tripartite tricarboxylate transporter substrate-binding protein [Comamonas composti]|uniref:tripartite tricarboxylate transporter substrate-binding protein n=1 Tax=Comamonas composti TaxID=408558 RepID=UPI000552F2BA|nr:tripartite tricarboxylate transporter substrate-binding protein [Comamonas composti]